MEAVVLVIHLIVALALISLVLIQRSEGGGLGIGGGGGGLGGFASPMGMGNALTRATAVCAALFFATNLVLAIMAGAGNKSENILEGISVSPDVVVEGAVKEEAPSVKVDGMVPESEIKGGEKLEDVPSVPVSE